MFILLSQFFRPFRLSIFCENSLYPFTIFFKSCFKVQPFPICPFYFSLYNTLCILSLFILPMCRIHSSLINHTLQYYLCFKFHKNINSVISMPLLERLNVGIIKKQNFDRNFNYSKASDYAVNYVSEIMISFILDKGRRVTVCRKGHCVHHLIFYRYSTKWRLIEGLNNRCHSLPDISPSISKALPVPLSRNLLGFRIIAIDILFFIHQLK